LAQGVIKLNKNFDIEVFFKQLEVELRRSDIDLGQGLSEIIADFASFEQVLFKWQKVQNLVSRETLDEFWSRHIADSLQLLKFFNKETNLVVDFGSGGGFPAIVLAIALKKAKLNGAMVEFVLVEANSRKVAFLRAVKRELGLNILVKDSRIENFKLNDGVTPDIISARALASLDNLLGFSNQIWGKKTRAIFLKGKEYAEELKKARVRWQFNVVTYPNVIDVSGVVLEIDGLLPILGKMPIKK